MAFLLNVLKWLLWPVAVLYRLITGFRNHLYNIGSRPSVAFELPTICVGNLSVGGTGKTPHIEYLLRLLLQKEYKAATLSRGYGRKTKGPIIAEEGANAEQIGDEPMQFFRKFYPQARIAVGEERVVAIPHLLDQHPETGVILLDDAYQHRKLKPSFQILLTEYSKPFYQDYLLPMGRLRESRKGAKRAQVIVVTKCSEELEEEERREMERKIMKYADLEAKIFFTKIQYGEPTPLGKKEAENLAEGYGLVTGIANPQPLIEYLGQQGKLAKHWQFKDHHHYKASEIKRIVSNCPKGVSILLTEKDAVKWELQDLKPIWADYPVYYLPIEVGFLEGEASFRSLILDHLLAKRLKEEE